MEQKMKDMLLELLKAEYLAKGIWMAFGLTFVLTSVAIAQQPTELVIRNGLIVNATGRMQGDLRIRNGTIMEIGANLTPAAGARVIDATGKLLLPGGIDPHVHLTPVRTANTLKGADWARWQPSQVVRRPSATLSTNKATSVLKRRLQRPLTWSRSKQSQI